MYTPADARMIGTDASTRPTQSTATLAALFFCSGASALIYQVLWLRTLGWVFGVTVYAASTVWACFMGGLALGSAAGGRLADRVHSPLRWFGAAEIVVGATALARRSNSASCSASGLRRIPRCPTRSRR